MASIRFHPTASKGPGASGLESRNEGRAPRKRRFHDENGRHLFPMTFQRKGRKAVIHPCPWCLPATDPAGKAFPHRTIRTFQIQPQASRPIPRERDFPEVHLEAGRFPPSLKISNKAESQGSGAPRKNRVDWRRTSCEWRRPIEGLQGAKSRKFAHPGRKPRAKGISGHSIGQKGLAPPKFPCE